jgi:purine-binding chemotaxis protein CheW
MSTPSTAVKQREPAIERKVGQVPVAAEQYLTFLLGDEMFAIGILVIKEIIEYHALTVVPMMPPSIRGVINLRGSVVPVIDLSARFGRRAKPVTKRTCIVIVEVETDGERQDIGVVVDAVNQVLDILPNEIEPAPAFGAKLRTDFIRGMGKVQGKFIVLLEVNHVLSLDEIGTRALRDADVEGATEVA